MPRPTSSTTVANPRLASLAYEFAINESGYIATKILPMFPVDKQAAEYPVIPTEALLDTPEVRRAPRGAYNRGSFKFENDTYSCVEYGWEEPVDAVEAALYSDYFDAETVAMRRAVNIVLRAQEIRVATELFNATTFSGKTSNVSTEWSTPASCTPVTDVKTAKMAVWNATGIWPNAIVMSRVVRENLNLCAQIIDRAKYTNVAVSAGEIPDNILAQALGVDMILVGDAKKNSAKEGQSATVADIWDDEYALVCRVESGRDITIPSLGRTFVWTEQDNPPYIVEQYEEVQTRGDIIRVRQYTDEEILFVAAGYLLGNITA